MTKDRQQLYSSSCKPVISTNDNDSTSRLKKSDPERDVKHQKRSGRNASNASCRLPGIKSFDFPIRLTDKNDRTWLLKDASSEPVECVEDNGDFAPDRHCLSLTRQKGAPGQAKLEEDHSKLASPGLDLDHEVVAPTASQAKKDPTKKKRLPEAIDCSPTKRRFHDLPIDGIRGYAVVGEDVSDVSDEGESEEEEDEFQGITFESQGIRVSEIRGTMVDILKKLQQKGLKQVLKAMLRKCHPQKQATFPYNGGKLQEQKRIKRDPEYDDRNPGLHTAPDYWLHQDDWKPDHGHVPTGCRHREPDHIYKPERINLTMHLLHAGDRFKDAKFSLEKLKESTLNITKDYPKEFQSDAERLIEALYYAREKEIQYENGEIDSDTIVYVPMPAHRPAKAKRVIRSRKTVTVTKQDASESSGFFDLGTPINPSPSVNSSFRSDFNAVKVESVGPSPYISPTTQSDATVPDLNIDMKRLGSQASSYPSTSASEGPDATHSSKSTPAPSEGDTEADVAHENMLPGPVIKLDGDETLRYPLDPEPQLASCCPSSRESVVTTTSMHMPSSIAPAVPGFNYDLRGHSHQDDGLYGMPTADQQTVGPLYFPDQCVSSSGNSFVTPSYASSIANGPYQTLTQVPTDYVSFLRPPIAHSMAPPPSPAMTRNMGPPSPLTGYPSSASSDFNGAMPIDPDWHAVDFSYEHFHDGTYQQQHRSLPLAASGQSSPLSRGHGDTERRLWATAYDAMAHEPQRLASQPPSGSGPQQQQQQQHGPLAGPYPYPFLHQQRGGMRE